MSAEADQVGEEILAEIHRDEVVWSETVQVGDWVDASDDGHYTFSGHQYRTKGKLYQVKVVDIRADENGKVYSRTVIVDADYTDPNGDGKPERMWLGPGRVIVRNGVIVWESSLQKSVNHVLANRHEWPEAKPEEWARMEEMQYQPDLSGTC